MDVSEETAPLSTLTGFGGAASDREPARPRPQSGTAVSLQLLEFRTRLLEVVEELHIRRDAETRFEEQISKLVLEKQELEWEKESLVHQVETESQHQARSLLSEVQNQFQAKLRSSEEANGKYQVAAGLKDKEISSLKEELKTLQLLKYNLEKKSSELEQKLVLQSRSKDRHLSQLGQVEKRFSALYRQCAVVKQAHEKLQQDVDEAVRTNKKLVTVSGKQEATIASLKKELQDVNNKLVKVRMTSVTRQRSSEAPGGEQRVQQLHHKLNMETELNQKLQEENQAERAEKKEVMRSLQCSHQLVLGHIQTLQRVELERHTQTLKCQALKQEHEALRARSEAAEARVVQLTESFTASTTCWDKERTTFLDRIRTEREEVQEVRRALQLRGHGPRCEPDLQVAGGGSTLAVPPRVSPTSPEEEQSVGESGGSAPRGLDALRHSREVTGAPSEPAAEPGVLNLHRPPVKMLMSSLNDDACGRRKAQCDGGAAVCDGGAAVCDGGTGVCDGGAGVCDGGAGVCDGGAGVCDGGTGVCDGGAGVCDGGAAVCDGGAAVCDGGAAVCDGGTGVCDGGTGVCDGGAGVCDGGAGVCDGGAAVCDGGTGVCDGGAGVCDRGVCDGGTGVCDGGAGVCDGGAGDGGVCEDRPEEENMETNKSGEGRKDDGGQEKSHKEEEDGSTEQEEGGGDVSEGGVGGGGGGASPPGTQDRARRDEADGGRVEIRAPSPADTAPRSQTLQVIDSTAAGPPQTGSGPSDLHRGPPQTGSGPSDRPQTGSGPSDLHRGPPQTGLGPSHLHQGPPQTGSGPSDLHRGPPQTGSKVNKKRPFTPLPLGGAAETCRRSFRSLFDWKSSSCRTKAEGSDLHPIIQGSSVLSGRDGASGSFLVGPPSTSSTFLKNKPSKDPLDIVRAWDLLDASSGCGTSTRKEKCSRAPPADGDTEDQQLSSGAQSSDIERFLRVSKRRRADD